MVAAAPDLYLCLDLTGGDPTLFDAPATSLADVMTDFQVNGALWQRTWRAFKNRDDAIAYAGESPTLVVIPLQAQYIALLDLP